MLGLALSAPAQDSSSPLDPAQSAALGDTLDEPPSSPPESLDDLLEHDAGTSQPHAEVVTGQGDDASTATAALVAAPTSNREPRPGIEPETRRKETAAPTAAPVSLGVLFACLSLLLGGSFFFSSSETALFSLTRVQLSRLERVPKPSRAHRAVLSLMADSRDTLITILIGNMMVNVATSLVVGTIVAILLGNHPVIGFFVGTILATLALLVLGEILPKTMALETAERWALAIASPLIFTRSVFKPLRFFFSRAAETIFRILRLPAESESETVSEHEIKGLVMLGHEAGVIQSEQLEMIDSVFDFNDETVDKIMTPRVGLQSYPIDVARDDLIAGLVEGGHSRVIIFQESIDDVVGVLHLKDILLNPDADFRRFMRQPLFVPEKKKLSSLLAEFRRSHQHLAIVVDEYGGTAGCVTLNDLLEEIFGDLVEVGDAQAPGLRRIDTNIFDVDGLFRISDLNDELEIQLPEDESNTVSGLISNTLGDFPKIGTKIEIADVEFVVRRMAARRVALARITVTRANSDEDAAGALAANSSAS